MNYKHGNARHGRVSRTYRCWQQMLRRCNGTASTSAYYTKRGIKVCERWNDYRVFLGDMGEAPDGMSLDRIDNSGNYEPSNCRWATHAEQMRNTRYNVNLTLNGKTQCVAQWARELGIPKARIHSRLKKGWEPELALSTEMFYHRSGRRGPRA